MNIKSTRGHDLPVIDNFLFHPKDKERKYFRCCYPGCAVTCIKQRDGSFRYGKKTIHNHQPLSLKKKNFQNKLKEEATNQSNNEKTAVQISNEYKRASVDMKDVAIKKNGRKI